MRFTLQIALTAVALWTAAYAQGQTRFQGLDRNNDGRITRAEWRGSDQSFKNQDWNGDGVLSGEEIRPGSRRQNWNQDWNRDGRVDSQDEQIAQRYSGYDIDNDGRVTTAEWPGDQRLFARLDADRDRYLTMEEYTTGAGFRFDAQRGPSNRFATVDVNRDGWVTRSEWALDAAAFDRLDVNRDNRVSRFEFENDPAGDNATSTDSPAQFAAIDANRDGWVTRAESRMSNADFNRFDTNNDNRISRFEFENVAAPRSAAWRSGYERGVAEGRAAGREDFERNQGWDLEGQRELKSADSGYTPQAGSLSDYQGGYREGFRNAYREGFSTARERK